MALVLNVREKPTGGGLLPAVDVAPSVITASAVVILVHGYNERREEAAADYDALTRRVPGIEAAAQLCEFFWPGDRCWGPLSSLSYSLEIAPARASAALLARFLAEVTPPGPWPLRVFLVCHSLGCRVGLETVARGASADPGPEFHACLMAAAVPVRFVEANGALRRAAEALGRVLVLHSRQDRVLGVAFRIGEAFAFEGWFPEAVGWAGAPADLWGSAAIPMSGYSHDSYWGGSESCARVAALLGLAPEREIGGRSPLVREGPTAASVFSSSLGPRQLPLARGFRA